jgi:hypothetical protein
MSEVGMHRTLKVERRSMTPNDRQTVITTESWAGQATAVAVRLLHATAVGAVIFIALHSGVAGWDMNVGIATVLAAIVAMGAAVFVLPIVERWLARRGTWELTDDEVSYIPRHARGRRSLSWADVERVTERPHMLKLHGTRRTVVLGSGHLGRTSWTRLRDAARTRLAGRHELAASPEDPSWWQMLQESPRLTAVGRAATLALFMVLAAWLNAGSGAIWPVPLLLVAVVFRWLAPAISRLRP